VTVLERLVGSIRELLKSHKVTLRRDISRLGDGPLQTVERLETSSPAETEAVGARLAARLKPGDVVVIAGELGAGKTTLVRGACRQLGVSVPVTSPTFTIGQRYPAPVPISHLDLFRLGGLADEEPDLLADYFGPDRIAFIEWPPDHATELISLGRILRRVRIEHAGEDRRVVEIAE
jgi:tRNA threonylcarbamoyladenosine biosynthesis protein TsaE